MNARLIVPLLALLAFPAALEAQAAGEAHATATVEATIRAGLPDAPVRRTVAEGRARGATEAQIDRAALATHARLRSSRDALRGERRREPTSAEIVAGADALLAGARPSDLARLCDASPDDRSLVASLTVLAELTSRGVDSRRAAGTIAAGLEAGAADDAIVALTADGSVGSLVGSTAVEGALDVGAGLDAGLDLLGATSAVRSSVARGLGVGGR